MLQVVADSSCDLPNVLIQKYSIRIIPLTISIGDRSYVEGVDLSPEEFYAKMAQSKDLLISILITANKWRRCKPPP